VSHARCPGLALCTEFQQQRHGPLTTRAASTGASSLFRGLCAGHHQPPTNRFRRLCVEFTSVAGIRFAAVRAQVSLAEVLDLVGFVPSRICGDEVRGPCPVHRSASPRSRSFSANLKRHVYHCFTCGSAGNQLDLYAAVKGLTIFEAAVELCEQLQREIPWVHKW